MSGSDLTNQLAGELMRFRTVEVAFMGDIGAIYYQVQLPKEQNCFKVSLVGR